MTNAQIIAYVAATVYGEEAVMEMIESGIEIPLHTVKGWAARGPYRVKKGEHGLETRLWKRKKKKDSSDQEEKDEEGIPTNRDFYLCKSFLFREDQVERVEE